MSSRAHAASCPKGQSEVTRCAPSLEQGGIFTGKGTAGAARKFIMESRCGAALCSLGISRDPGIWPIRSLGWLVGPPSARSSRVWPKQIPIRSHGPQGNLNSTRSESQRELSHAPCAAAGSGARRQSLPLNVPTLLFPPSIGRTRILTCPYRAASARGLAAGGPPPCAHASGGSRRIQSIGRGGGAMAAGLPALGSESSLPHAACGLGRKRGRGGAGQEGGGSSRAAASVRGGGALPADARARARVPSAAWAADRR